LEEDFLFATTFLEVDEEKQQQETEQWETEEEVKGQAVVAIGGGVDYGGTDDGPNEGGCFAHYAVEGEE
jgi:hypothetical protein